MSDFVSDCCGKASYRRSSAGADQCSQCKNYCRAIPANAYGRIRPENVALWYWKMWCQDQLTAEDCRQAADAPSEELQRYAEICYALPERSTLKLVVVEAP